LEYNGTNVAYFNWLQEVRLTDDFIFVWNNNGLQIVSDNLWNCGLTNGAFTTTTPGTNAHPGIFTMSTSTSGTGNAGIFLGNTGSTGPFIVGGGAVDIYWIVKLPTLSTSGERYVFNCGFGDTYNNVAMANGIYFTYSDDVNSGNWRGITSSASSPTNVDGGVAAGTSFTTLRINVNAAASTITFYVNGTSIGTSAATIPTTTIAPFAQIKKTNGTTARTVDIDLFYLYQKLTAAR